MTETQYTDDLTISDNELLYRRIPTYSPPEYIVPDLKNGGFRPTSLSFSDDKDGSPMSVGLDSVITQNGGSPEDMLRDHEEFALASITVGQIRECGLMIVRDPRPGDPAHALIVGKKTKKVRKKLAKNSDWVVLPSLDGT